METNQELSPIFKRNVAKAVLEFIDQLTMTQIAFSRMFSIPDSALSFIKSVKTYPSINAETWKIFAAIANKAIYIDSHFIKDCRADGEPVKYNMMDYQSSYRKDRDKSRDQNSLESPKGTGEAIESKTIPVGKNILHDFKDKSESRNNVSASLDVDPGKNPSIRGFKAQEIQLLKEFKDKHANIKVEFLIAAWENSVKDIPEKYGPLGFNSPYAKEIKAVQEFWLKNPDISFNDLVAGWEESKAVPTGPTPEKTSAGLTDADIERLKSFGLNFKKGVYMVHGDTVVELLAPVDVHTLFSQIIREEFDRCFKGVEWVFEDHKSEIKSLKPIKKE